MSDTRFAIVFQGQIADGADQATVRDNLARLFKAPPAQVDKMFSGQKVVIKKGLDSVAAGKYKVALGKAGAVVEAVAMKSAAGNTAVAATPAPAPAQAAAARTPPAAPATVPAAFADAEAPPDALDTSLAEVGETLIEYQQVAPPDITTDHLSVAEAGVVLVESQPVAEPEFDLSSMSLDPPGTTLIEPAVVPEPQFNFDGMSLEENA